jgi:hypothetical protein
MDEPHFLAATDESPMHEVEVEVEEEPGAIFLGKSAGARS